MKHRTKLLATVGTAAAIVFSALAPAGQAAWFNRGHHGGGGSGEPLYCVVVQGLKARGANEFAQWIEEWAQSHGLASCEGEEIIKS